MSTYLIEIGTEELPAKFANSVVDQFDNAIRFELNKASVEFDDIFCSSTPRRVMVLITGLIDFGKDEIVERKGPKASIAYPNGIPGKAAVGFANSLGIDVEELEIRDTDKGKFVFGKKIDHGQSTKILISSFLPKVIKNLHGQRFMKWGYGNFRFSRPIRWIVSLYNDEILNFSLDGLNSDILIGNSSSGHRLVKGTVRIDKSDNYLEIMESAGVLVDRKFRKKSICNLINNEAKRLNLFPLLADELLDELTDLVENPRLIVCSFEDKYLNLPSELLCTVMKNHQRYIPLFKNNRITSKLEMTSESILDTKFFCISNGLDTSNDLIRVGNEKVLKARFSDAKFFVESDSKNSCEYRNQKLKNVSYLKGLGNIYDKVKRTEYISLEICNSINLDNVDSAKVVESIKYSKHDLCSEIVYEFPELQGLMGGKYLQENGFCEEVSLAVAEHYLPRFSNDDLPSSIYGAIVSISDKLENIISIFVTGIRPSGSSDPFALRRNLNGIIQIAWHFDLNLPFVQLINKLLIYWNETIEDCNFIFNEVYDDLLGFLKQRIISHLHEINDNKELIKAITELEGYSSQKIFNIIDLKKRLNIANSVLKKNNFENIRDMIIRVTNLSQKGDLDKSQLSSYGIIDKSLFEKECEKDVYSIIQEYEKLSLAEEIDYEKIINLFDENLIKLENLFDNNLGVLIISDDLSLRKNRLNMLGILRNYLLLIADFALI